MHRSLIALFLFVALVSTALPPNTQVDEENRISKETTDETICFLCDCYVLTIDKALNIDCSKQNLTELPSLKNKWKVISLNLSGNALQELPDITDTSYSSLRSLDLSANHIVNLTENFFSHNLSAIYLDNNNITRMSPKIMEQLSEASTIEVITLHGNPWKCDYQGIEFADFVQAQAERYRDFSKVTCADKDVKLINLATNVAKGLDIYEQLFCGLALIVAILALIYKFYCIGRRPNVTVIHNVNGGVELNNRPPAAGN